MTAMNILTMNRKSFKTDELWFCSSSLSFRSSGSIIYTEEDNKSFDGNNLILDHISTSSKGVLGTQDYSRVYLK